jgi:hypothetical protein
VDERESKINASDAHAHSDIISTKGMRRRKMNEEKEKRVIKFKLQQQREVIKCEFVKQNMR